MSGIFEDPSVFDTFSQGKPYNLTDAHRLEVGVVDWFEDSETPISQTISVPEVADLPEPLVRIIFSPLDTPDYPHIDGLLWLFNHYSIPSTFIEERLRSTTHSFGALTNITTRQADEEKERYNCAWIHYLCKNITLARSHNGQHRIGIPEPDPQLPHLSHADWTWIKCGFFLHWKERMELKSEGSGEGGVVTLICFDASSAMIQRFLGLSTASMKECAVFDPYCLLVVGLKVLAMQMDYTVYDVVDVFREVELKTLSLSKNRESFTGLHNISKNIVFLQESSEAILLTMKGLIGHHRTLLDDPLQGRGQGQERDAMHNTHRMLLHTENEFHAANLRLRGLEKRMQNIVGLSFHLVTQEGNTIMQSDSNSMSTIAFVTLIFLPISTVSTIFGSQFFSSSGSHITVSRDFWIFWVISVGLTAGVIVVWHLCLKEGAVPRLQHWIRFGYRK